MRSLICAALLALVTTTAGAANIDIAQDPNLKAISIVGQIEPGDFETFKLRANQLSGKYAVLLAGPGGSLIPAIQIGEYIRLKGWATLAIDECDSACAAIWLAGMPRWMVRGAKVGFHAASGSNGQEKGTGNAVLGAYMTRLGLGYDAVYWATTASPDEIAYLTSEKAKELGIDTNVIEPDSKQAATPPTGDPYQEGVRDYSSGLCYRARPYLDGPADKAALWDKGFHDAERRDQGKMDRSYCFPRAALEPPVTSHEPTLRDCSAISAELFAFFTSNFNDCYRMPEANLVRARIGYKTIKVWDSYLPSSGRYVTRTLQACAQQCTPNTTYRLVAKDHDASGGSNGGSVCYFNKSWSDCETNMGEHYQLKAGSIKAFLNIATAAAQP